MDAPHVVLHRRLRRKPDPARGALVRLLALMDGLLVPPHVRNVRANQPALLTLARGLGDLRARPLLAQMFAVNVLLQAHLARVAAAAAVTHEPAVVNLAVLEELVFGVEFVRTRAALEVGVLCAGVGCGDVAFELLVGLRYFRTETTRILVGVVVNVQLSHVTLVVFHAGET